MLWMCHHCWWYWGAIELQARICALVVLRRLGLRCGFARVWCCRLRLGRCGGGEVSRVGLGGWEENIGV